MAPPGRDLALDCTMQLPFIIPISSLAGRLEPAASYVPSQAKGCESELKDGARNPDCAHSGTAVALVLVPHELCNAPGPAQWSEETTR